MFTYLIEIKSFYNVLIEFLYVKFLCHKNLICDQKIRLKNVNSVKNVHLFMTEKCSN